MNISERVRVGISLLAIIISSYFIFDYINDSPWNVITNNNNSNKIKSKRKNVNSQNPVQILLSQNTVLTYGKDSIVSFNSSEIDVRRDMLFDSQKTKRIRPVIQPDVCLSFDVESDTFTWLPCQVAQNDQWEYNSLQRSLKNLQTGAIYDNQRPMTWKGFTRPYVL